jgi:hypothetical protein
VISIGGCNESAEVRRRKRREEEGRKKKERRKEGRKEGETEARKEGGRREGGKDGRMEGRREEEKDGGGRTYVVLANFCCTSSEANRSKVSWSWGIPTTSEITLAMAQEAPRDLNALRPNL